MGLKVNVFIELSSLYSLGCNQPKKKNLNSEKCRYNPVWQLADMIKW